MPYAKLIVNPSAGAGKTIKQLPLIHEQLKKINFDYTHVLTEGPGHAIKLAQEALSEGVEMVVAVGGDGTINEIVNGIYRANSLDRVMLGIISTGTGADYIRTIGISRNLEEECNRLKNPHIVNVDIGKVVFPDKNNEERLFVNFAGLGFDAQIVKSTTQKYKSMGKVSAYLLALLTNLIAYRNKDIILKIGDTEEKHRVCTVIMGNGKYGGGGMMTTPEADIRDGMLDVMMVVDISKPDLIHSLPRIYKGTHLTHPKVVSKRAPEISISASETMAIQADGDIIGDSPAIFSIIPGALRIAV